MTNLEEKSPIIIKKLLSNDLETRKSGLKLLQEETQKEWIPEYREYLWKTISQEKSKEFQLKLIKFAYNKMKETSLRKMIRLIENNEIHLSSQKFLSTLYIQNETDDIRGALLKSLSRDENHIPKFVVKILNNSDCYSLKNYKENHLIIDLLSSEIPLSSRIEFLTAIMNWYFKKDKALLLKIDILKIIKEDQELHLKFLNEYLNTATPTTLQFTKPHHQPHFSFISQKDHKTPNKSDSDTSWINPTPELVFLYDSLSSTSPAVRIQTIELISKIPIPFDLEPNNHDFNIFSIWNVISINNLDTEIFNIEEINSETTSLLFKNTEFEETPPAALFTDINPHQLFFNILAYLPRYHLIDQFVKESNFQIISKLTSILSNRKFWLHKKPSNLDYLIIGPKNIWEIIFNRCIELYSISELKNDITKLIFTLLDFIDQPPNLSNFWPTLSQNLDKIFTPLDKVQLDNPTYTIKSIINTIQKSMNKIKKHVTINEIDIINENITSLVNQIDDIFKTNQLILTVENEINKFESKISQTKTINRWFEFIENHLVTYFSNTKDIIKQIHNKSSDYLNHLSDLVEKLRTLYTELASSGSEVNIDIPLSTNAKKYLASIKKATQNKSIQTSPYELLINNKSTNIKKYLLSEFKNIVLTFNKLDSPITQQFIFEINKENSLFQNLETQDPLKLRINSSSGSLDISNLPFDHENQLMKYFEHTLLKLPETFENILQNNIINLSESNQLELLNNFDTLISLSLIELSNEAIKNIYGIFTKSNFIRIRTKSQLYLNIFSQPK